ncbi:7,8-didemethyl-8-hydroxy-5-deazariboflavin synthase subunit CofG [Methanofervidicoccus abyssi]|uniref:7,8-didemethyl-8-hydroxy-5-deazariboflavin synthase n=1 Tax=Methanofervidicoccus abyssi TaxID=2082189 RepID=A0A401HQZ4_9EURY|nr:7,8-didemethyl-8-hydroxy-5-deazariboflavin synthase subunit CofG [Methanofervidicoccus abyssi]GBF36694.1 FO synthase subunit 1 [Methanofervidicoccus abyssi]
MSSEVFKHFEDYVSFLESKDPTTVINTLRLVGERERKKKYITYSKNVFIPLCNWCRNFCGYCIFRRENYKLMKEKEVKEMLLKGNRYGCKEALFTFGERVDENPKIREELKKMGYESILEYLYHLEEWCLNNTNLLPHTNCGLLEYEELKMLKEVNASMGIMLENSSERLMNTIAHRNSPGKDPKKRLEMIENAGKLKIPFTTGILVGIGENSEEIVRSLMDIRELSEKYGHIQEVIIQNFRSKRGIPMEDFKEPSPFKILKVILVAKMILPPEVSIQVPPNLNRETGQLFLLAGVDDWGGVSPITEDYVNPEAPWPEIETLREYTEEVGYRLRERLPVYDRYISREWLSDRILNKIYNIKKD